MTPAPVRWAETHHSQISRAAKTGSGGRERLENACAGRARVQSTTAPDMER